MQTPDFYAKQGETLELAGTLRGADGSPQDLTGTTVTVSIRRRGAATPLVSAAACTIVDPQGQVRYVGAVLVAGTWPAGRYEGEFDVTLSNGRVHSFPDDGHFILLVSAQIG